MSQKAKIKAKPIAKTGKGVEISDGFTGFLLIACLVLGVIGIAILIGSPHTPALH